MNKGGNRERVFDTRKFLPPKKMTTIICKQVTQGKLLFLSSLQQEKDWQNAGTKRG